MEVLSPVESSKLKKKNNFCIYFSGFVEEIYNFDNFEYETVWFVNLKKIKEKNSKEK